MGAVFVGGRPTGGLEIVEVGSDGMAEQAKLRLAAEAIDITDGVRQPAAGLARPIGLRWEICPARATYRETLRSTE